MYTHSAFFPTLNLARRTVTSYPVTCLKKIVYLIHDHSIQPAVRSKSPDEVNILPPIHCLQVVPLGGAALGTRNQAVEYTDEIRKGYCEEITVERLLPNFLHA